MLSRVTISGAGRPIVKMYIGMPWILLFLRIVLAVSMLYYGWPKIRDLKSNARDFDQMGFRPAVLWGTLIAVVEFCGGVAIFIGLYGELAAGLFGFQMMVGAFWKLKRGKPFTDYSYDLYLFCICLVMMSQGTGALGLATFPGYIFLRWDVAVATLAGAAVLVALSKPPGKRNSQRSQAAPSSAPA